MRERLSKSFALCYNNNTVLNPIKTRDHLKDKEAVMDILACTNEGTLLTIEIQIADEHDMQKRATYYWSVVFASQMLIGMQYSFDLTNLRENARLVMETAGEKF